MGWLIIELRQLRYFLTVLRIGSINRAAAVLNVTQPSLSHSIKSLERSIGAELIIRGGGGVRATAIGAEFAAYANNIVREAEKARAVVAALRGGGGGRIAFGVLSAFANNLAPGILSDFFAIGGTTEVDLFVYTAAPDEIARKLLRAEWDLALTLEATNWERPAELGVRTLGLVKSSVYCGAAHPLAGKAISRVEELAQSPWIASNLGLTDSLLASVFAQHELRPRIALRTDSMTLLPSLLTRFSFLCMAPDVAVAEEVERGVLVRLDQDFISSESRLAVLFSNLSDRTPAMRSLITIMSRHAHELGILD